MFLNRLRAMMYGRYGTDKLNLVLLILGLVLSILGSFFFFPLSYISMLIYIFVIFRSFSKNISARQKELYTFERLVAKVTGFFGGIRRKISDRKVYKYFRCPNCKQQLRAPKHRGKIFVTCQRCKTQFTTKV